MSGQTIRISVCSIDVGNGEVYVGCCSRAPFVLSFGGSFPFVHYRPESETLLLNLNSECLDLALP